MRVVAVTCMLLALAAAGASASTRPTLQLASSSELVVRGAGFARFEPIKLTVFAQRGPIVRRLRATRQGAFKVRFDVQRDMCTGGPLVQATGPQSGIVRLKLSLRECPELEIP